MLWVLKITALMWRTFEHPKHMFKRMGKKKLSILFSFFLFVLTYDYSHARRLRVQVDFS